MKKRLRVNRFREEEKKKKNTVFDSLEIEMLESVYREFVSCIGRGENDYHGNDENGRGQRVSEHFGDLVHLVQPHNDRTYIYVTIY